MFACASSNRKTKAEMVSGLPEDRNKTLPVQVESANTVSYFDAQGRKCVRYHETDVVITIPATKKTATKYILNSGGYKTQTTKRRIEQHSPYRIWSQKGQWYVSDGKGQQVLFFDGIVLPDAFTQQIPDKVLKNVDKEKKLKEKIKKFCQQVLELEELPKPNGGDCWCCMGVPYGGPCVKEHLKENYLHGSLLVKAMRADGYQEAGIRYNLNSLKKDSGLRMNVYRSLKRFMEANVKVK